ncbi:hypothetical protein [Streptomyces sp. NPDC045369]|uniref:hypothetical protein n=1 Tax=Streptomyces sp. NPDC045369 TaxID=3155732 RepID=UPI0033E63EA5
MKTVTLGMFAVGFLILVGRVSWFWFKSSSRDWKLLGPFALSATSFAAAGACVGGLLGTVFTWARERVGDAGDWALEKGTGAQGVSVTRSAEFGTLTPFGAVIMLALIVVFIAMYKSAKRKPKKELTWGAPCGLTLGPFLGAVTIVPAINALGDWAIGGFFH